MRKAEEVHVTGVSLTADEIRALVSTKDGETVHVDKADPQIVIASRLLDDIRNGWYQQWTSLDGDVLKIHGINRTVIYRIGEKVPDLDAYYAEWPD
jgi:hypothetical protein